MNNIDYERLDSLDGWVAIKSNIFEDNEIFKLGFIVQWNVIESKFAVTCHNRTLQRQKRKEELAIGDTETSWAGLFSVNDLRNIHRQFTGVGDVLTPYFPDLSAFEGGNIWDLIFPTRSSGSGIDDERDLETPCRKLEKYFSATIDICGRKIVLDSLFSQNERDVEEYFENLQEFKKKTMQDEVSRTKHHLREFLQSHGRADKMVLLLQIYEGEDQAYQDLVTVATTFFQYLLQPFRDMRELACLYRMEITKSLEYEEFGPKRIAALEREAEEWRMRADDAVSSIQDITVSYFIQTSKALAGMLKQMEEDKCRFGAAAWASAAPRLEKLQFLLAKETLQQMRATEMCLNRKKDSIRMKMKAMSVSGQSPGCDASQQETVDQLELQFYEAQLELYDTRFEALKNEEQLLVAQIETLRRQIRETKEEVVYYDVCEDPEELQSLVHTVLKTDAGPVNQLKRHLQTLETKRGNICARRAYIRNKKDQCVEAHEKKHRAARQNSLQFNQHHGVHLKRERRKEEEQRRKEWVDQEREKTLSRLRTFREKRPGQYVLKTAYSNISTQEPSCADPSQPLSIISLCPSPSTEEPSNPPTPVSRKTPRKPQSAKKHHTSKAKDIPVHIYAPPLLPPVSVTTPPANLPPPPPPPPLPPLPLPPPLLPALSSIRVEAEDKPTALSEKEAAPFPAKNTLKQNLGSMDQVLASLQRGQIQLRRVPLPSKMSAPGGDMMSSLLCAIREGVTLKKAPVRIEAQVSSDNDLERSIKAAMQRMKKVSADSEDEEERREDEAQSAEWDS